VLAKIATLVREADALYRSHHYNEYHFLVALSDVLGFLTLEHGQSSEYSFVEKDFLDEGHLLADSDQIPHEYTHSWNGKYRRPERLYQADFATPQQGALLWVYEGLTQYLGDVLAARSGLKSQAQYRDLLAWTAAYLDCTPGREWRSTEDTAISSSILREGQLGRDQSWSNWKRGQDYYDEGELLWLDADTLIRKMTNNQRTLDDFLRIFLGKGGNTGPLIVTYTFEELVRDLNEVMPYDWATFFHDRVYKIHPNANLAGIERGGYRLVYADKPTATESAVQLGATFEGRGVWAVNAWYSIGGGVNAEGIFKDVRQNGPADKARIAPEDKIIAVNGQIFSGDRLRAAIRNAKGKPEPIHLIVQSDSFVSTIDIDYHEGERYPVLERVEGMPDYLDDITKPLCQLSSSEKQQVSKQGTKNPEAYALYLKGRSYWAKQTRADLETAVSYFNQAIAKDPGYAIAYAGLADAYAVLPDYGPDPSEDIPKAKAAALKAIELDPSLSRPHVNLGGIKMAHEWDFAGGEAEFKKALQLDPNDSHAHERYADNLGVLGGREQEALAEINRAHQLDPNSLSISVEIGVVYTDARRFDEAIGACKKVANENPSFASAHSCLVYAYWGKRIYPQVIEEQKIYGQLSGERDDAEYASAMEQGFRSGGWNGALTKGIEVLQSQRKTGYSSPYTIATMYADLGDKEQAFQWLNTALQEHSEGVMGLKTDFLLDSLRSDPRFAELVRKVGLPQ
jgi:tetratricopeptide (TPR) repeat protein